MVQVGFDLIEIGVNFIRVMNNLQLMMFSCILIILSMGAFNAPNSLDPIKMNNFFGPVTKFVIDDIRSEEVEGDKCIVTFLIGTQ